MTKQQFITFGRSLGWHLYYSGRTNTMYIDDSNATLEAKELGVTVVIVQHFGILPDFRLDTGKILLSDFNIKAQ